MKSFALRLLKLFAIVIMLALSWETSAIAVDEPSDLQSFVMQAADHLEIPLFPFVESSPSDAQTQDADPTQEERYSPFKTKHQSLNPKPNDQAKVNPLPATVKQR